MFLQGDKQCVFSYFYYRFKNLIVYVLDYKFLPKTSNEGTFWGKAKQAPAVFGNSSFEDYSKLCGFTNTTDISVMLLWHNSNLQPLMDIGKW